MIYPSILPPASTELEKALEQVAAGLFDFPTPIRAVWSPSDCPIELLPWLAWALSVDQWSADWPLHIRRARVAAAIAIQRIKGTAQSVVDVVASFGGNVVVREWFEQTPPGDPHTFDLTVTLGGQGEAVPSAEFIDAVISEVARTKPTRSHFEFTVSLQARARIGLRAVARPVIAARLWCNAT